MRMSRPAALVVGAVTVWPVVYIGLFIAAIAGFLLSDRPAADPLPSLLVGHLTTMLVMMGLTGFYLVHVLRNRRIGQPDRAVWLLIVLLTAPVGMAVYWWRYIWQGENT